MTPRARLRRAAGWMAGGAALAAAGYAAYVGVSWLRYGRPSAARGDEVDPLLDRFMPVYDVVDRHHVRVAAPADITYRAAAETDLLGPAVVRAIFKARELVLGARPGAETRRAGLLAEMQLLGWGVLAEEPGREIVMGAVTQPWLADVVFRALPPEEFERFREPGFVKIAWTLRSDPVSASESIVRTETRVITTDPESRAKFRWYWARFSAGMALIRRMLLNAVREEAERRARGE